ncbi:MAG: DMT family transporter [Acidimicrobiia bacterium]
MEVVLGAIGSLLYGVADFLGGEGARRAPAASIVLWSGLISFPLIAAAALLLGGEAGGADYVYGALAGLSGTIGLVLLFAGLGAGRAAAVAPASAAVGAVLPVLVAVLDGERPSLQAWIGVGIAVPAIVLSAWGDASGPGSRLGGLPYGVGAGIGFGGFTILIRNTADTSNLLPLIATRASTVLVVGTIAAIGLWRVTDFARVPRSIVTANAILDVSGNVAILFAIRAGSLALAAVSASFYPAVTVLIARIVNGEGLRVRQITGVVLTLFALVVIATG